MGVTAKAMFEDEDTPVESDNDEAVISLSSALGLQQQLGNDEDDELLSTFLNKENDEDDVPLSELIGEGGQNRKWEKKGTSNVTSAFAEKEGCHAEEFSDCEMATAVFLNIFDEEIQEQTNSNAI